MHIHPSADGAEMTESEQPSPGIELLLKSMKNQAFIAHVVPYRGRCLAVQPNCVEEVLMWQVFGGTVNCGDGALTVRTTAAAADTTVARLARLVEEVLPLPNALLILADIVCSTHGNMAFAPPLLGNTTTPAIQIGA